MNDNLIGSFSEFKSGKNIDRPKMIRVLVDVFCTLLRKKYGSDENFEVIVSPDSGDVQIWRRREIVPDGEVEDERAQISILDAIDVDPDANIGEDCYELVPIPSFGRRAIMAARQTLISRILELEKDEVYKRYSNCVGDVILGEVSQVMKREILVIDDATGSELIMPRTEMIRGDYFKPGDMVRGIISKVDMKNGNPVVILSRTDNKFLERLLEQEVPEIEDGLITIKGVVRIPGERAKVAVESYDERIDPVGACVGMKGSRIHGIVRELRNENIDIINYTTNTPLFIQRALTPARVSSVEINTDGSAEGEEAKATAYLRGDEVSKAIGKRGVNIKLACRLTGFNIDVLRDLEDDSDIDLDEFRDEIDGWIVDTLKHIGCDTAKSILSMNINELVRRSDLEEETIIDVVRILEKEFEGDE